MHCAHHSTIAWIIVDRLELGPPDRLGICDRHATQQSVFAALSRFTCPRRKRFFLARSISSTKGRRFVPRRDSCTCFHSCKQRASGALILSPRRHAAGLLLDQGTLRGHNPRFLGHVHLRLATRQFANVAMSIADDVEMRDDACRHVIHRDLIGGTAAVAVAVAAAVRTLIHTIQIGSFLLGDVE